MADVAVIGVPDDKYGEALLAFVVCAVSLAYAHSRFELNGSLPPRSSNDGLKIGPCGNVPPTNDPACPVVPVRTDLQLICPTFGTRCSYGDVQLTLNNVTTIETMECRCQQGSGGTFVWACGVEY